MKSAKFPVPSGLGSGDARGASSVSVSRSVTSPTKPVRISYLTEQTSHHPPVSAFYISCPEKGLHAKGFDQITAKFTGTSIKVMPGEHNLGIFITVERRDNETYQLTHPPAHLGGLLKGSLSVSVGDMAYITCPQTRLKAILHYYDDGWLGRGTNRVEGIIFRYDPEKDDKQRISDVPEEDILVRLGGAWKEKIVFTLGPKPVVRRPPTNRTLTRDTRGSGLTLWGFCAGLAPSGGADHHHRHRAARGGAQGAAAGGDAAPQRVAAAVARGDRGDPRQAVLAGDGGEAGARGGAAGEGARAGAQGRDVEARLLRTGYRQGRQAVADGEGPRGAPAGAEGRLEYGGHSAVRTGGRVIMSSVFDASLALLS